MQKILKATKKIISTIFAELPSRLKYDISFLKMIYHIETTNYTYIDYGNVRRTFDKNLIYNAFLLHHKVRQMYDNKVYFYHVLDVFETALQYDGVSYDELVVCLFHDTIEDCGITYSNLSEIIGEKNALSVIRCSEYSRGLNRAERKPKLFYDELVSDNTAMFAKGCDIFANTRNSTLTKHSMAKKYRSEWYNKVSNVYKPYLENENIRWIYNKINKFLEENKG